MLGRPGTVRARGARVTRPASTSASRWNRAVLGCSPGTYGTQPGGTAGEPSGSLRRAVALVDAVHRALLHACPVQHVHAGLPDNVGHPAFPVPGRTPAEEYFNAL